MRDITKFPGASVLPYTTLPGSDYPYFILGQEANEAKNETWDAWGGARDPGETETIQTAAREYNEESMGLLGELSTQEYILNDIELNFPHSIVLENSNNGRTYITYLPPDAFQFLSRTFYPKRKELIEKYNLESRNQSKSSQTRLKKMKVCMEKSHVGIVSRQHLLEVIKNTPKNSKGWPAKKVYANILVIDPPNGQRLTPKTVELRPLIIYTLSQYAASFSQDENA